MPTHGTRCFYCGGSDLEPKEVEELLSRRRLRCEVQGPGDGLPALWRALFRSGHSAAVQEIRAQVREGDLSGLHTTGALLEPAA